VCTTGCLKAQYSSFIDPCTGETAATVEAANDVEGATNAAAVADIDDADAVAETSALAKALAVILAPGTLKVCTITVANGADNIGVYLPLFAGASAGTVVGTVVIFYILLAVWIFSSYLMLRAKFIAEVLSKYGEYAVPPLLIGLGLYILKDSVLFEH
jgi:cadmium resistance protein CadD (predicted permease)